MQGEGGRALPHLGSGGIDCEDVIAVHPDRRHPEREASWGDAIRLREGGRGLILSDDEVMRNDRVAGEGAEVMVRVSW